MLVKNLSSVKDIATHIIGMAVHDPPAFGQATAFVAKIQMWEAQNGGDVVVQAIQKTFLLSFTCAPGVANEYIQRLNAFWIGEGAMMANQHIMAAANAAECKAASQLTLQSAIEQLQRQSGWSDRRDRHDPYYRGKGKGKGRDKGSKGAKGGDFSSTVCFNWLQNRCSGDCGRVHEVSEEELTALKAKHHFLKDVKMPKKKKKSKEKTETE